MSDIIRLLPDSVANQIAAGEVVKRPASVIKELVENAADAGATRIDIFVKDGGRTLIQVIDNGKGMSPTDARMAFERHATSKITNASDLFSLHTMGFRGEALPSICAISQVELRTRRAEDSIGTRLLINGSKVERQEPDVCEAGTNIAVRNLFYNVPARRKFMRSDSVETSYILREFERMALVNNNIHLTIDTGSRRLDLRAANFRQRISDIWKNNLNEQLVGIDVSTDLVKIHGYVSRPEYARRRNTLQYMMANGRNMYHPRFHKAVLTAFDTLIATDTQPNYFIKMEVNPDTIDVNIHPTKNEIKFEYEQQIWSILHAAVKAALGKNAAVPSIDFSSDVLPVERIPAGGAVAPEMPTSRNYNPFRHSESKPPQDWQKLYDSFMNSASRDGSPATSVSVPSESLRHDFPEMESVDQHAGSICLHHPGGYIVTTSREGLIVIDQHRAHLTVLYERVLSRLNSSEQVSQSIMFPDTLVLDSPQLEVLREMQPKLREIGFLVEQTGENVISMSAVPAMLQGADAKDVLLGMIDSALDSSVLHGKQGVGAEAMREKLALNIARSGALNKQQRLTAQEMEQLVGDLFSLPNPGFTPEGNPVYRVVDPANLF